MSSDDEVIEIPARPPAASAVYNPNYVPYHERPIRSGDRLRHHLVTFLPSEPGRRVRSFRCQPDRPRSQQPVPQWIRQRVKRSQPRPAAAGVGFRLEQQAKAERRRRRESAESEIAAAIAKLIKRIAA